MEKNKVTVYVVGQKLNLVTTDSEKYVTDIASKVETRINSLMSQSSMSKEKCAVMAALDFCDDEAKARQSLSDAKEQIKDYIEDSAKLRAENDTLKAEIEKLKAEKQELLNSKKTIIAAHTEIKAEKEDTINADDDLSFDLDEVDKEGDVVAQPTTPTVEPEQKPAFVPSTKSDKKRHNHDHVNPYKERFMQQKDDNKGYTPVRQYTLFDNKDE